MYTPTSESYDCMNNFFFSYRCPYSHEYCVLYFNKVRYRKVFCQRRKKTGNNLWNSLVDNFTNNYRTSMIFLQNQYIIPLLLILIPKRRMIETLNSFKKNCRDWEFYVIYSTMFTVIKIYRKKPTIYFFILFNGSLRNTFRLWVINNSSSHFRHGDKFRSLIPFYIEVVSTLRVHSILFMSSMINKQ